MPERPFDALQPQISDPNATGAAEPLPRLVPGTHGREAHERAAALTRGEQRVDPGGACAPDIAALRPEPLFTLLSNNVRDYAADGRGSHGAE